MLSKSKQFEIARRKCSLSFVLGHYGNGNGGRGPDTLENFHGEDGDYAIRVTAAEMGTIVVWRYQWQRPQRWQQRWCHRHFCCHCHAMAAYVAIANVIVVAIDL